MLSQTEGKHAMDSAASQSAQMKRRTIVKGAAWAAPAITVGVAAPQSAASPPPVAPSIGNSSCKHTKSVSRYHIELIFTNSLNCSSTVNITSFVVNPFSGQDVPFTEPPVETNFTLSAKGSRNWTYDSDVVGNMANGTVDVTYTYTNCQGQTVSEFQSINVSSLPPCDFDYPHNATTTAAKEAAPATESSATKTEEAPAAAEAPTQAAPTESAPTESTPAESAPVESAPEN